MLDAAGYMRSLVGIVDDIDGVSITPEALSHLATLDPASLPLIEGNPRIGACLANVGKLIGIGLNYSDHAAEANLPVPTEPITFLKATSAISGPYDPVEMPDNAEKLDWEVELAFAIGTRAKHVSQADALSHVAGYLICNDVSERCWQAEREGQWTKGKSHDTFAPIGPWLVTADEVPDSGKLGMRLDVNGVTRQNGSTETLIFSVAYVVSYLSQFMTLEPGDIITTGTPPGVGLGMKPQVWLKPGDEMELWVDGLGYQKQTVTALKTGA